MAIIGSIRKRGTLLLVVVGLTMLAFILTDLLSGLNRSMQNAVFVFGKKEISDQEYFRYLDFLKGEYATILNSDDFSDDAIQEMNANALRYFREREMYIPEMTKAGIRITLEEEKALFAGAIVHPQIRSMFTDPETGMFDPEQVLAYDRQLATPLEEVPQENWPVFAQARTQWSMIQRNVVMDHRLGKYQSIVAKTLYVTELEAREQYRENSSMVSVQYFSLPYASIPDSTIRLEEKELERYFSENIWKYRSSPYLQVQYAFFAANPTPADSADLKGELLAIRDEFIETDDDTSFIYQHTKGAIVLPRYVKKGVLPASLDSMLFNAPSGTVAGPVMHDGKFVLAKKLGEKDEPDSVFTYHILFQPQREEEVEPMRKLRDSLLTALKNGANFFEIQAAYNQDEVAKADSGKVGWISRDAAFDPMYIDSSFACPDKGYFGATTQFGFHIIYRSKSTKAQRHILYGEVSRDIEPGKQTLDDAYNKASNFALADEAVQNPKEYMIQSRARGMQIREEYLSEESRGLMTVAGANEVSRWALDAEVNTMSQVFTVERGYLVAVVSGKYSYEPKLNDVRDLVVRDFIRKKKYEMLAERIREAMNGETEIVRVAEKNGEKIREAFNLTWNGFLDMGGSEQLVISTMFGAQEGQLYGPVEGFTGAFLIRVVSKSPAADQPDYTQSRLTLSQQAQAAVSQNLLSALLKSYSFRDFRYRYE